MSVDSKATNVWEGDLASGSGTTSFDSSGVLPSVPVSWAARAESHDHQRTSPEELVAGAHASCYNMALSNALGKAGTPPERLTTSATVTFSTDGGAHVSQVALRVRASVPGMSADDFHETAAAAKDGCPISKLVAGNVEISLDAELE